ncbi:glycosyl transferase [Novosphingobium endophyticum]|uniref:Glycosyl transferase n=1 Tax=Novosphingobium endophyticum TaxID=1955250 RepID=A0A916TUJ5_9SPHN|nr:glycosyltransferase [Novosphingobium endophyticum]GGC07621.1 glycosyl transferase [Novosphingobium endophyticum]
MNVQASPLPRQPSAAAASFSQPRVAIVHYWLVSMRGGERVLERMLGLYPQADLFTHVYDPAAVSARIRQAKVTTSFIDRLPFSRRLYQYYLPLMPMALEELDLSGYDLVISSEAGPSKGVITAPASLHACYCHSPMRYLWDHYHRYKQEANWLARAAMPRMYHRLREWDVSSSARVDRIAANSHFIRQRIRKVWRREAEVIHPPVETSLFTPSIDIDDYYLWVGQMVPYKRPDLAVDAFNASGLPLLMVGSGGMSRALKARAGPNVRIVDRLDFAGLQRAYARSRALVMTAEEDFGLTPVEAMASGRPVVGYARGGLLDTVEPGRTGVFFESQETEALIDAVARMEDFLSDFDPRHAIERAAHFSPASFDEKFLQFTQMG